MNDFKIIVKLFHNYNRGEIVIQSIYTDRNSFIKNSLSNKYQKTVIQLIKKFNVFFKIKSD